MDLGDAISELEKFLGIWATIDSLVTTQWNITKLGKLFFTLFYYLFALFITYTVFTSYTMLTLH